jgi:phospholipid/cholesterol/gamma-HCH transport system substrate-binding protein
MNKQAPSAGRIITMIAFAGSCVGLLIFLWISFGGATPFAPQGYLLKADFNQATELGTQADVRISGVSVGRVISVGLDRRTGLTQAVMEIDSKYAPRPDNTRAILRAKTLLGETYVELTPGSRSAPALPDDATLPEAQIAPTVQLDQILSTFDPTTRRAFETWMQQDGIALTNRGENLNAALAELFPFATNVQAVLSVLNRDSADTTTLLRDTGAVFSALSQSPSQLQGFIRNSDSTFAATAAQDVALADTIKAFPPFLIQTRATINRVSQFATLTKPLIDELRPAAVQLSPALQGLVKLSPELRDLFVNVGPLTAASKAGVPALEGFLNDSVPLLARLKPYLGGVVPVVDYINDYRREIAGFFGNSTAATENTALNATATKSVHLLRLSNPIGPDVLAPEPVRLSSNRGNPYLEPGGYTALSGGLPVFGGYLCTNNPLPTIGPTIESQLPTLVSVLENDYFTSNPSGPPCSAQPPLGSLTTGQLQDFPHLTALP